MSEQRVADALAEAVIAEIQPGMIVGMGTGRTASRGVVALAERVKEHGLEVRCVPTSHATETLARYHGLPVMDFAMVESVDLLFDGADEVDPNLRMLKGAGGAMTRERIVAWASKRRIYMVDESKLVDRLGTRTTLAVAVLAFGLSAVRSELRSLGLNGVVRRTIKGELFITDNGNLIVDVALGEHDVEELDAALNSIPGVVDHGLFLTEADEVFVERSDGSVDRLRREG
ncbi:MAG: ribose 5-phosphate isomerase A [Phycisphaerales bacterium]|nr:ribose 5-phosphate isomerase A [Phycisphaerales bacterium]